MKKFVSVVTGFLVLALLPVPGFAATTQVDSLIEKLVDKGVLTRSEGIKLKGEIAADEKIHREEGLKQGLPKWVQDMKLKGDFRLRYQYERRRASTEARTRGRIRFRLGLDAKVNDTVTVGAGLATGGSDPRSTNQTLENTFETPDIRLDYAYAKWQPATWIKVIGGKFERKDYLWNPTDLVWDGDINPNGASAHLEHKFSDKVTGFGNTGVWLLDEDNGSGVDSADRSDPFMTYAQGGLKLKEGDLDATIAGIYYGYNGVKGKALDNTAGTNTLVGSALMYDYDAFGGSAEMGIAKPLGIEALERVAIFGDYINNVDPNENNMGWSAGVKFGDKKVDNRGKWQAKYIYAYLEKDAVPDTFPDSDRFGGATDVRSYEGILEYGLSKNVTLGLDYYYTRRLLATANPEKLIQADLVFKF